MTRELLATLRREFYEWCGCLSVDEACGNPELIRLIERLESTLLKAADATRCYGVGA